MSNEGTPLIVQQLQAMARLQASDLFITVGKVPSARASTRRLRDEEGMDKEAVISAITDLDSQNKTKTKTGAIRIVSFGGQKKEKTDV